MKLTQPKIYTFLIVLFVLDAVYFYGFDEDVAIVVKMPLLFLGISSLGFLLSYFFNKTDVKHKVIMNIVITLGVLLNAYLILTWYILKDFGF